MTLDDLRKTLHEALASGKIGEPVAIRLSLHVARTGDDAGAAADAAADFPVDRGRILSRILKTVADVFNSLPETVSARSDANGRQLNLLVVYSDGRTLCATLGIGCVARPAAWLLVVGNHGVIRLEGGEELQGLTDAPVSGSITAILDAVDESLASGQPSTLSSRHP